MACVHKQGNPGSPIISSSGHPTERISEFFEYHVKSLVQSLPSYTKDTTHVLPQREQIGPLPDNAILVTLGESWCLYELIFLWKLDGVYSR